MFFHEADDLALRIEELFGAGVGTDFREHPNHDREGAVVDTRALERVGEETRTEKTSNRHETSRGKGVLYVYQ